MSDIKQVSGIWLPAAETHLPGWFEKKPDQVVNGLPAYQYRKIQAVMRYVPPARRRVALDIGAHCGLWAMHLARLFKRVHCFEPVEVHRRCLDRNVVDNRDRVTVHAMALGNQTATVGMHVGVESSGDSWVDGPGDIPMRRLDDIEGLGEVDLMKLDCEGYELFALRGGAQLLKRCRPTIIVEQKPRRADKYGLPAIGAVDFLKELGATERLHISGDYILTW